MIILMIVLMLFIPASVLYARFQSKNPIAASVVRDARVARYDRALRVVVVNRLSGGNEWL